MIREQTLMADQFLSVTVSQSDWQQYSGQTIYYRVLHASKFSPAGTQYPQPDFSRPIFVGTLALTTQSVSVYVNDILKMYRDNLQAAKEVTYSTDAVYNYFYLQLSMLPVFDRVSNISTATYIALVYPYKNDLTANVATPHVPGTDVITKFTSEYPNWMDMYTFAYVNALFGGVPNGSIRGFNGNIQLFTRTLAANFNGLHYERVNLINGTTRVNKIVFRDSQNVDTIIAKQSECNAEYYLQWIDRYGAVCMFPFAAKNKYNEDVTTETATGIYGNSRMIGTTDVESYELGTGWLTDEQYATLESIMFSPWVKLYDSTNEEVTDVIVTTKAYTEKRMRNEKRLFRMTINVQNAKKQTMLW